MRITGYYNVNVTFISSKKEGLLKFDKFEFRQVSSFPCIWKKNSKVFGKNNVTFWQILLISYMLLFFITYDNYDYSL